MAAIKAPQRPVPAPAQRAVPAPAQRAVPAPAQRAVPAPAKSGTKPVDGFAIVDISNIEFLESGRGGGKPMDPAVFALVEKALTLEIGQGFKIPTNMRIERDIVNKETKAVSVLHTYKGAPTVNKHAAKNEMRLRTRRDKSNNLWLFRDHPVVKRVMEVEEEAEGQEE